MRSYHEKIQACLVDMQPAPNAERKVFSFVRQENFKNNHTRIAILKRSIRRYTCRLLTIQVIHVHPKP